ncbi:MAG: hypothetical protein JWN63_236 [Candidatus Acidoferrum typicum]|nr:hypothetical protein [Candidatus Acidoferrum typicum]
MSTDDSQTDAIDWSLTTWEGARREQMRRWGRMPLAEMILALEEMQVLAEKLAQSSGSSAGPHERSQDLTRRHPAAHQRRDSAIECGQFSADAER